MSRRFARDGGRLEVISGGDRVAAGIGAYQQVYSASWKKAEPYPEFVAGLITTCADKGWLRLGLAWLGEKVIAAQLWIVAEGRAEIYKLAYDQACSRYSPGSLLTAHLMQQVLSVDGVSEVDYLTGDDGYKSAWMSQRRERFGLVAYNPRTLGGAAGMAREVAGRLWRRLGTLDADNAPSASPA
jgi:CelD/BcsL family acetyltransferase involved in cellulose biosynthesis